MARTQWRRSIHPATCTSEQTGQRPREGLKGQALVLREDLCPVEGRWVGEEGSEVSYWVLTAVTGNKDSEVTERNGRWEQRGMAGVGRGQWSGPRRLALVWKEEERRLRCQGLSQGFKFLAKPGRCYYKQRRLEKGQAGRRIWSFTVNTKEIHWVLYRWKR